MSPFRNILVAADYSESSRAAFSVACSLAHVGESTLSVLHVLAPPYVTDGPVYLGQQAVQFSEGEGDQGESEADLEHLRKCYAPSRPIATGYRIEYGLPSEMILRDAEEIGSDLIVMGTHGRTGLGRLLLGSIAEAVMRGARCSVLAHRTAKTPVTVGKEEVILHATDLSEHSQTALRTARVLAKDRGARLMLVHVMPMEMVMWGPVPVPLDIPAVRESLTAMARELDGPDLKYPVESRLVQGEAAAEIVRLAEEEPGCSLIVLGTHGRTGVGRLLMGSVAEAVLRHSNCPVLAVKAPSPAAAPTSESEPTAAAEKKRAMYRVYGV